MTKLEERLKQLLSNFEPFNYGNSDDEQRDAFVEGFKAALEMPELKALEKSIKDSSDIIWGFTKDSKFKGEQRMGIIQIQENKRCLSQWLSFIGDGVNEANS